MQNRAGHEEWIAFWIYAIIRDATINHHGFSGRANNIRLLIGQIMRHGNPFSQSKRQRAGARRNQNARRDWKNQLETNTTAKIYCAPAIRPMIELSRTEAKSDCQIIFARTRDKVAAIPHQDSRTHPSLCAAHHAPEIVTTGAATRKRIEKKSNITTSDEITNSKSIAIYTKRMAPRRTYEKPA